MVEQDNNAAQEQTSDNNETSANTMAEENMASEKIQTEAESLTEAEAQRIDQESIEKMQAELNEYKDKYVRLYADFENMRRRNAKEKLDMLKNANEELLKELLPVIDDFERAQKSIEQAQDIAPIQEGVKLIYEKMTKILKQKGLIPMENSIGKPFDIEQHESITQIPAPEESLKGKVVDEVERGYYLHEKVIRFAKVVVGS